MRVLELRLRHFRGFRDTSIRPVGHVILMGTPGGGRSDAIDGLSRVLDTDYPRRRPADEFDFFQRDTTHPAEVEATIAELGTELEQYFLDQLELWDTDNRSIVDELESPEEIDRDAYDLVLRVCYRAEWSDDDQQADEFTYYPKTSDPSNGAFTYDRSADLARLEFARIRWGGQRVLDLGGRSAFRRLIQRAEGEDFSKAVGEYLSGVAESAEHFADTAQVKAAVVQLLKTLAEPLRLTDIDAATFKFVPEGGAASGLLRSLVPALDLRDTAGLLPVARHGSTAANLFRVAEALALAESAGGILAMDDLGDGLDSGSAMHLAAAMQKQSSQVWIATRSPSVAEIFNPDEVFRLSRDDKGERVVYQGHTPRTKIGRIAAKHWTRNLLPALNFESVIVLEGPDDFLALHALSLRLFKEQGKPLPSSLGVTLASAAATGSGGSSNVPRLARFARNMGLWSVGVIDWDRSSDAESVLERATKEANCVIRLPEGFAIERALLRGLPEDTLRESLAELVEAANLSDFSHVKDLGGSELEDAGIKLLKSRSLHGPFVEWLPSDALPPIACQLLETAVEAARNRGSGHIQL